MKDNKLKDYIKEKRPVLSDSSLITYNSILKNLYKKVFDTGENIDVKKFNNDKEILEYLKDLPHNKRKTILSALFVITDNKKYRELMNEDIDKYNKDILTHEKDDTQKKEWITPEEIKSIYDESYKTANALYNKKKLTLNDLQHIQNYIILSLLSGIYISPRRSKDYVDFKIKNIDKKKDNYIDRNQMVFNSYKTSKYYGEQRIDIPKPLKRILNKWILINPTEYLLFDLRLNKLTNVKLNQRLNRLFGSKKGRSINMMRHSFLTDKYGDMIKKQKEINDTMESMGSSSKQLNTYIKNED